MEVADLNKVWEIKALKKTGHEQAKKILDRIAKQVQPIMHKRKWRVKLLSEFCPKNPRLLGLNVGKGIHVKLRLRRPDRDDDFYPYDQVLDTMLHELCHNTHGPHNASFYQLWDELRKECEDLLAKGISGTGQGFDLPGQKLGGSFRQPPLSSLRKTALAAAEERARLRSLLPAGPIRLGGDKSIMSALSPVQAAAMAAERRLQDEIWCASSSCDLPVEEEIVSVFSETERPLHITSTSSISSKSMTSSSHRRSREPENTEFPSFSDCRNDTKLVDLTADDSDGCTLPRSGKRLNKLDTGSCSPFTGDHSYTHSVGGTNDSKSGMWSCETCTLLNRALALLCEACNAPKPKTASEKSKFWSCKFCTLENGVELDKCLACGQWRYSHGSPASTRAPYLGT